ncbi:MAG TPA: hypothetical protein PLA20_07385 [Bacilli bacterium]|jgi:hypothetical protein|nr:hypothetical protein [Acholeplasmataceae bacterium]OQB63398.1 MAG: hypothetical protein BWX94_00836 [Tenericutes bacterium ADurb.Bin140]HON64732.1 hypothetical protein [Bacilli bacterium]HOR96670.1 hypothetical protein [Bacilli bacterium]HPD12057.1 hypothetical protein [Bacilli bacterium]
MKIKIAIIICLTVFAFLNNFIIHFDEVKALTNDVDITIMVATLDPRVEKAPGSLKVFWHYLLFFLYFFNPNDLRSILKLYP